MLLYLNIKKGLLFFIFLNSIIVLAQNNDRATLSGKVLINKNSPLSDATVYLQGTNIGVQTDVNGHYTIKNIPFKTYIIVVSYIGYTTVSKEINVNDLNLEFNFELTESTEKLEQVSITGKSQTEQNQSQGYIVNSLVTTDLQSQSVELNTVLNQSAGIKVRQDGGLGSRVTYAINGLSGKSVRFFIDGVPMDYFGSSYSVNTIPISLIDKIEVYKGVIPIELGNDALGGAINLVSKKQLNNHAQLAYSYGSFNTHVVSFHGNYRNKKTGLTTKLATFYNYSDNDYKVWGKDVYITDPLTFEITRNVKVNRFHDAFKSKAIKADIGFTEKKWADSFFLGMLYSDIDKEIQHGSTMQVPYGEATYHQKVATPYLSYQKKNFLESGLHLNWFTSYSNLILKRIDTTKNIYNWYGQIEGTRTLGGEQTRTLNTLAQKVFLNRVNLTYSLNQYHKIGYNYIYSHLNRTDRDPLLTQRTEGYFAPQKLQKHSMGLALQSHFLESKLNTSLFSKWFRYSADIKTSQTSAGIKTYNTEKTNASGLGYGLAVSYELTQTIKLNASLEKTYRLPESEEILGDGLNIISTTLLKPESSLNVNAGFSLGVLEDAENQLNLSGNVFYRSVTNLIQQFQYDLGTFVYINFDEVLMKGFDARIEYHHNRFFSLHQTVSFLEPIVKSEKDKFGNNNVTLGSRLPNTPFFQSSTEARFKFKNIIQKESQSFFYWTMDFTDGFYKYSEIIGAFNKDEIPQQWVHNCGVGYTFPKENISISFDVRNIFNEQLFDNYAIQKPGRAAYVKMVFNIK